MLVYRGEGKRNGAHRRTRGVRRGSWGQPSRFAPPEEIRSAVTSRYFHGNRLGHHRGAF